MGSPAFGQPNEQGEWVAPPGGDPPPYGWAVIAKHAVLLSTGKVLVWNLPGTTAKLWNPTDGAFTDVPADFAPPDIPFLKCAGHAALADGSLLAAGGGNTSQDARDEVSIFRLSGLEPWEQAQVMNHARWYPTCTTLPDGRILAVAGTDNGPQVDTPEIYDPADQEWTDLAVTTTGIAPTYPFMFLLPDGKIFYAGGGSGTSTYRLDVQIPTWEPYPANNNSIFGGRKGAGVMYEPWKILKCGGQASNAPIEQRTAMIDLTDPTPTWVSLGAWNMPEVRKDHNLVLLPDGKILLVGGTTIVADEEVFVHDARMWDPFDPNPTWVDMADMVKNRGHHSVALLLPDATVLSAGGFGGASAEIYKPAYLYTGTPRPKIGFAPSSVPYDTQFNVILAKVPTLALTNIAKVTLIRPGSVTHWLDSDQRFLSLEFTTQPPDTLVVTSPLNGNDAPPGYYMLFVVTNDGVPSKASWIKLAQSLT